MQMRMPNWKTVMKTKKSTRKRRRQDRLDAWTTVARNACVVGKRDNDGWAFGESEGIVGSFVLPKITEYQMIELAGITLIRNARFSFVTESAEAYR